MTQKLKTDLRDRIATAVNKMLDNIAGYTTRVGVFAEESTAYMVSDKVLEVLPPIPGVVPVNAQFEVVAGSITGTASVPVKRVEMQDDGSVTVTLDFWPTPPTAKPVVPAGTRFLHEPGPELGDKRMSELTADQKDEATELWLRKNIDSFRHDTYRHISFLLDRLSNARFEALQQIAAAAAAPDPHLEQLLTALSDSGCVVTRNDDGDYQVFNARAADIKNQRDKLGEELASLTADRDNLKIAFDEAMKATDWVQEEYTAGTLEIRSGLIGMQRGRIARELVQHLRSTLQAYKEANASLKESEDRVRSEKAAVRKMLETSEKELASARQHEAELMRDKEALAKARDHLMGENTALRAANDWVLDEDVSEIDTKGSCGEVAQRLVQHLKEEVTRLNNEVIELVNKPMPPGYHLDNPELDGTDNAHPAWWRAYDNACAIMCQKLDDILTGKDIGEGTSNPPWQPIRERLINLVQCHDEMHDKLDDMKNEVVLSKPTTCVLGMDLDMIGVWEAFKSEFPRNSNAFDAMVYGIEHVRKKYASALDTPLLHPKVTVVMENAWADLQRGRVKVDTLREAMDFGVRFALQGIYPIAGRREAWTVAMKEQMIRHYLPEMDANFPALLNEVDAQRMAIGFYEARKLMVVAYDITETK